MNDSPPKTRLRSAAPIVLSIVFLLLAGLVVWASTPPPPEPPEPPTASPPPTTTTTSTQSPPTPQILRSPIACGSQPGDRATDVNGVLRLGSMFPSPGPGNDSAGAPLIAATQMAADDVNLAGGIPNLPAPRLELDPNLDEGAPGAVTACGAASGLLAGRADVMVGPYASASTRTIYSRITQAGRLMVSPSNTLAALSDAPDQGRYFRTASSDELQAEALAGLIVKERRDRGRTGSVAVVVEEDDPFASSLGDAVIAQLNGSGVPVMRMPYTDPGAFAGIAGTIQTGPYDDVAFVGFRDIAALVGMVIDRGKTPQTIGFYGSTGLSQNNSAGKASGGDRSRLEGLRGFVPWAEQSFNDRLRAFYQQRFGALLTDETYGAQTYDAVIAVVLAAAAARSDDPGRIADELPQVTRGGQKCGSYQACADLLRQNSDADIDYDGASGPLGFTAGGDVCQGFYNLSAFGATGTLDQRIESKQLSRDLCP